MRRTATILLVMGLAITALIAGATSWLVNMPGAPTPAIPVATSDLHRVTEGHLMRHVQRIAFERNAHKRDKLEEAARYIEADLESLGYKVRRQTVPSLTGPTRNLEVSLNPSANDNTRPLVIVGAHYDTAWNTPGANDNGSGVAALLELARRLRPAVLGTRPSNAEVRLVFFTNEEPPHFKTPMMGSFVYAAELEADKRQVVAMYSLETMGSFSDQAGSQQFPVPGLDKLYPNTGNFIAFIGTTGSRELIRQSIEAFRASNQLPSEAIAAPGAVQGIDWSDHWSFNQFGYPGLMVTDTAPFRYKHYHEPTDTPGKIDYARLARVTLGLEAMLARLYFSPAKP